MYVYWAYDAYNQMKNIFVITPNLGTMLPFVVQALPTPQTWSNNKTKS